MTRPRVLDESPLSAFVSQMIDAHKRRLRAETPAEKRAIEREMEAFLAQYFERDPRAVVPAVSRDTAVDVPRATARRHVRPGPAPRYASGDFDHKLAAAGDRTDDDE